MKKSPLKPLPIQLVIVDIQEPFGHNSEEDTARVWAWIKENGKLIPPDPSKLTLADLVAGHDEPPLPPTEEVNWCLKRIRIQVGNKIPIDFMKEWDEMKSLPQPTPGAILTDGPADDEPGTIMKGKETPLEKYGVNKLEI